MFRSIRTTNIAVIEADNQLAFLIDEGKKGYPTPQVSVEALELFTGNPIAGLPSFDVVRDAKVIAAYVSGNNGTYHPVPQFSLTDTFRENAPTPPIFSESLPLTATQFKAGDLLRVYSPTAHHGYLVHMITGLEVRKSAFDPALALEK